MVSTRPSPPQVRQGAPGSTPLPPQLGQMEPNFMNPDCFCTRPWPPQVGQTLCLEPGSMPLPLQVGAGLLVADLDGGLDAVGRVHEVQVHRIEQVLAALGLRLFLPACGRGPPALPKMVSKMSPKELLPLVLKSKPSKLLPLRPPPAAGVGVGPQRAVEVVLLLFFRVLQRLVRLVDLLELLLGRLVAGVEVGVVLAGQFAVGLFYVVDAGVLADAEYLVVIFHKKNFTPGAKKINTVMRGDSSKERRPVRPGHLTGARRFIYNRP